MAPNLGTERRRIFEFLAFQRQLSILIYTAFVSRQSSSRFKKTHMLTYTPHFSFHTNSHDHDMTGPVEAPPMPIPEKVIKPKVGHFP